jgi:hypothetical protein
MCEKGFSRETNMQGEMFSAEEAIKMITACTDKQGKVWYEDNAVSMT